MSVEKGETCVIEPTVADGGWGWGMRKEIFCVSEPQHLVQHISHYSGLSRQQDKKLRHHMQGQCSRRSINKNMSSMQSSRQFF